MSTRREKRAGTPDLPRSVERHNAGKSSTSRRPAQPARQERETRSDRKPNPEAGFSLDREERHFVDAAYKAGKEAAKRLPIPAPGDEDNHRSEFERLKAEWTRYFSGRSFSRWPHEAYVQACRKFIKGYGRYDLTGVGSGNLLWPTRRTVGCVICAVDEGLTLKQQLDELQRLPFHEVILVLNGADELTRQISLEHPLTPAIVSFDGLLGYDVGRAVGALQSRSDILLFLDADMKIHAEQLIPFIHEIEQGADVVLNSLSEYLPLFDQRDSVSIVKEFLNVSMGRPDLQADSMTAVPHAVSRRAMETIGVGALAIPPLAQVRAIMSGLRVVRVSRSINVFRCNRIRPNNTGWGNPVEQLILGDHLEALHHATGVRGARLQHSDFNRDRQAASY